MEEAGLPAVRTSGYDSRDLIDHVVYPRRALSARRGAKHSLQRRQRAPRCLIFCLLSLRIRDISAFSLFAYSSLLRFAGLAKGNQFLLLATKMKKKDKEKKGKEEERQEEKEEEGRRIREQSCFPAILALLILAESVSWSGFFKPVFKDRGLIQYEPLPVRWRESLMAVVEGTWEDFPYYSKGTRDRACEQIVCCMQLFYPFSL